MSVERFQIVTATGATLNLLWPTALQSISGTHLPSTAEWTATSPQLDGDMYLGAHFGPRNINLALTLQGRSRDNLGLLRRQLGAMINPKAAPLELRALLGSGHRFRLHEVTCQGPVEETISYDRDATAQAFGVKLVAHDPVWYSDAALTEMMVITTKDCLTFPITFGDLGDVVFGATVILGSVVVQTLGDWDAAPIITITGPLDHVLVRNLTTDETIELLYTVANGEEVVINTTPGNRSITSSTGENLIPYLTDGEFPTFHLEPDSAIAPDGYNQIVVAGALMGGATAASITWYDRFTSI